MTTGVDTFTGTAKNDTFNAAVLTANDGDVLDGGEGSDTLNLETASSITSNFKTSSIETVNLTALGAVTVDAKNLGGMTTLNSNDATGAVTVNNLAATTTIGVKGSATNNVDLKYTTGALNGSADKLNVNLNGSSATTIKAEANFESVEVKTTAASTLTSLVAPNATALTLSGDAALTLGTGAVDTFTDYTVTNKAKVTYNDIGSVKTFNASTNTGGIVGADLRGGTGLDATTTIDKLTLSSTGSLVQTGSGNDNINVHTTALFSTNSAIIKLGAGNDTLALTAGTSGEYVYGEAGDDTIYVATALGSNDLIDGGEGTDTVSFAAGTHALIAKGIENVKVASATATAVNFTSVDSAIAIADSGAGITTFSNLKNGSTYTSTLAKTGDVTLNFATGQAATVNVDLTKGTAGAVTLTNVANATVTTGAASALGIVTVDATTTALTINGTGALTGNAAIAASGDATTEKLQTVTVTGNKAITLGSITNDASLTSVSVKSTGGAVSVGTIGNAANTAADVTVSKIEVASTTGAASVGTIDFSGVATTVTGNIAEITATAAGLAGADATIAAAAAGIVADKLGTVTATSTVGDATIGAITAGADTLNTAGIDGTVTALKASGLEAASIGAIKADSVGSIIVESTGTSTANDAKLSAIKDGQGTASNPTTPIYSIAEIGTVTVTSAKGDAFFTNDGNAFSAIADIAADVAKLGNVVVTGADQAETESIIVRNSAGTAEMANLTITAGTGAATLGDIIADTAGTITAKSTSNGVVANAMTFADTTGVSVVLQASTSIGSTANANKTIQNTKGDLSLTATAGTTFGAAEVYTVTAGTAATTDIDMVVDLSAVKGAVGVATTKVQVVQNLAQDTESSTIVKGGAAANYITIDGHAGAVGTGQTITYYGQTGADTVTLTGAYTSSTIYAEAGDDIITGAAGVDTINGGAGADIIYGNAGNDIITAGEGIDAIAGGAGADTINLTETTSAADYITFLALTDGSVAGLVGGTFTGYDVITGFTSGTDKLVFDKNATIAADATIAALDVIAAAKLVVAGTAPVDDTKDLTASDITNVDKIAAFLSAGTYTTSGVGQNDIVAITFADLTAIYAVTDAAAGGAIAAGEIKLLGTVDEVLVAGDIAIA